jgi:hypothetical protein
VCTRQRSRYQVQPLNSLELPAEAVGSRKYFEDTVERADRLRRPLTIVQKVINQREV